MARQSISFTEPNDEWLKAQVDKNEYSSKSELVNDLIRQARKQQAEMRLTDGLIRFSIGLDNDIERSYQMMKDL